MNLKSVAPNEPRNKQIVDNLNSMTLSFVKEANLITNQLVASHALNDKITSNDGKKPSNFESISPFALSNRSLFKRPTTQSMQKHKSEKSSSVSHIPLILAKNYEQIAIKNIVPDLFIKPEMIENFALNHDFKVEQDGRSIPQTLSKNTGALNSPKNQKKDTIDLLSRSQTDFPNTENSPMLQKYKDLQPYNNYEAKAMEKSDFKIDLICQQLKREESPRLMANVLVKEAIQIQKKRIQLRSSQANLRPEADKTKPRYHGQACSDFNHQLEYKMRTSSANNKQTVPAYSSKNDSIKVSISHLPQPPTQYWGSSNKQTTARVSMDR